MKGASIVKMFMTVGPNGQTSVTNVMTDHNGAPTMAMTVGPNGQTSVTSIMTSSCGGPTMAMTVGPNGKTSVTMCPSGWRRNDG